MSASGPLPRLSAATLVQARPGVALPGYDRHRLAAGIVHLGLGAFVRGHLACYTDDALAIEPGAWGIAGVSLKRPDQRDRLTPQNGLYATLQRDGDRTRVRVIGCVQRAIVSPEDPAAALVAMVGASCRIVSLTVTEKGYCHDPATGRLDPDHPDIRHDLQRPDRPRSAVGLIVAALRARYANGAGPFVVLCCDNLPRNGRFLAGLARDFAAMAGHDRLARRIEASVAFPSTMVDRIVPGMTAQDIADAATALGLHDAAPVSHEPFRQWVIEDQFGGAAHPAWDKAGAQFVSDVAPYEHMKLRLLNGAHSALACLGHLAGHETISDVAADPVFRQYVQALWGEIISVVPTPPGVDLHVYVAELLARFSNPAIRHRTWQIAMDGSQKLPQRLLSTARERLAAGLPIRGLALAVAGWMRYVGGIDESGRPIDVRDPLAARLRTALDQAGSEPRRKVAALLGVEAVFGHDLPRSPAFAAAVTQAYATLVANGARASASLVVPG